MIRYLFTTDLHYGYERKGGHKIALHDPKAWSVAVKFAQDFKPDIWILGGDMLDCGAISHHNKGKAGQVEGLRLLADAEEGRKMFIEPVERLSKGHVYLIGNHEDWLSDLTDEMPTLEGIVELKALLKLGPTWTLIPQGGLYNLQKLTFVHGDTLKGGEQVAKNAVIDYERSVRFGHFHTYQTFTKNSPSEYKHAKTAIAVPCLCIKNPPYSHGKPNRWLQGFLYGYSTGSGFNDYVAVITDGIATINGKTYHG